MTLKFLYSFFNTCKSNLKKGTSWISPLLCYFDRNVSVEHKWDHGWSTGSSFPPCSLQFQVDIWDSRHIKFAHKWICAIVSKHTVILQPRYQANRISFEHTGSVQSLLTVCRTWSLNIVQNGGNFKPCPQFFRRKSLVWLYSQESLLCEYRMLCCWTYFTPTMCNFWPTPRGAGGRLSSHEASREWS